MGKSEEAKKRVVKYLPPPMVIKAPRASGAGGGRVKMLGAGVGARGGDGSQMKMEEMNEQVKTIGEEEMDVDRLDLT